MYYCGFNGFGQVDGNTCILEPAPLPGKRIMDWDSCVEFQEDHLFKLMGFKPIDSSDTMTRIPTEISPDKAVLKDGILYSIDENSRLVRWDFSSSGIEYFNLEIGRFTRNPTKNSSSFTDVQKMALCVVAARKVETSVVEIFVLHVVRQEPPKILRLRGVEIAQLCCGKEHVMVLGTDGTVYTWGNGSRGQLGHGSLDSSTELTAVEALGGLKIVQIAAGGWHSVAVSVFGDVYVWGWNESGQLSLPCRELCRSSHETQMPFVNLQTHPRLLECEACSEETQIIQAACGSRHSALLTDGGEIFAFGWNGYGQLGVGNLNSTDTPAKMNLKDRPNSVLCSDWGTCVL